MLAHVWNSISPGMFSTYHFSCLFHWYYFQKPPHTFTITSFKVTRPRRVLLVEERGWLLYSALTVLALICTETFYYGCLQLSGVWLLYVFVLEGTRFATSRKVAGSIPDGVIGIFHWHNPSDRTMALGLTQPLKEMNTRNIFWGYRRPVRRADNLTTFMCRMSWNLNLLEPSRPAQAWNGIALPLPLRLHVVFFT
jgi:hypothetical protein